MIFINSRRAFSSRVVTVAQSNINLANYDSTQAKLMEEKLILVNQEDEPIGAISKKDAHSNAYF